MKRFYIFLIVVFCLPVVGFAQRDGDMTDGSRIAKPRNGATPDSIPSESISRRAGDRVFNTYPMPNAYHSDYAIAMPNGYRGDNCIPIPNAYQENPTRFTIKVDSIGSSVPDSVLMDKLDKLKQTLSKQNQQKKQHSNKAEQP